MLAECVNSRLRRQLNQRKQTDQGTLDLFRFFHNVRPLQRGKRAGQSPAQLVGLSIPKDPLTLLGLHPKCQANSGGFWTMPRNETVVYIRASRCAALYRIQPNGW